MEPVDDLSLRLHVEVHQRVPAHQKIEAGDWCIAGDVVTTEYDPSTQIRSECEMCAVLLKILIPHLRRNRLERLTGVDTSPGVAQRILINVCAIDLDAFRGFLNPK